MSDALDELDEQVRQWWESLEEPSRDALREAARETRMDGETARLLIDSQCPVPPAETADGDEERDWSRRIKRYILAS